MLTTVSVVPSTMTPEAAADRWLALPANDWLAATARTTAPASNPAAKAFLRLIRFRLMGFPLRSMEHRVGLRRRSRALAPARRKPIGLSGRDHISEPTSNKR